MSPQEDLTIRTARVEDAADIARLFLISSDGLAAYIWSGGEALSDTALIEKGAARYARRNTEFSFQNCLVAERDGRICAMLHAYHMPPREKPGEAETSPPPDPDPVLAPYAALEKADSYYISGVAVEESCRGLGIGQKLLARAHAEARQLGLACCSLICFDGNHRAMALYHRLDYRASTDAVIVPHPCLKYTEGKAVLLVKELQA